MNSQNNPSIMFWRRWLMVVTIGVSVLSITMVIAPNISRQLFSLALYSSATSYTQFLARSCSAGE
jgi:hypothetical protein